MNHKILIVGFSVLVFMTGCDLLNTPADEPKRASEARLMPLPEAQWNQHQSALLTPLKKYSKDGQAMNIFTTVARHPELFQSWLPLAAHILQNSSIPERERELIILRVGALSWSEYEFGQHYSIGKQAGLTEAEIVRLINSSPTSDWSEADQALIQAVDELHYDSFISDQTWSKLNAFLDEKQMLDLIFTVGQYKMVSMFLNSAGVQLDQGVPGFTEIIMNNN